MAGETEDKISMPFENSPEKAGSFTGLVAGLKYCLEQISVNKELRDKWNELLTPGTDAITSVVVLQRIVTFFLKSKQQIFREKGLKPNKNSVSLRQQVICFQIF